MNLPQITAYIGQKEISIGGEFSSIVAKVKKVKDDEIPYVVNMVFNADNSSIYFKVNNRFSDKSSSYFKFFGNNSAATTQFYLTRKTDSLKYLLTSTLSDLWYLLKKEIGKQSELLRIIEILRDKELVQLVKGKGKGKVNLNKFKLPNKNNYLSVKFDEEKKKIIIEEKKYSYENFIRLFIQDKNKKDKFVLVVPVVIVNNKEIYLCNHKDYLALVKKINNLGSENKDNKKQKMKVCHICGKTKGDVSSNYSKKFDRSGINKIFTITTKNSSRFDKKYSYDDVYGICKGCYNNLIMGEKVISNKFNSTIAGERVFILPEGLIENFDYNYMFSLKNTVDIAFSDKIQNNIISTIKASCIIDDVKNYSLNFIFYRTDGTSFSVLETIEDVPVFKFSKVLSEFDKCSNNLDIYKRKMNIGKIYRVIPVRINKDKKQVDIQRVLSLYKSIFLNQKIRCKVIYSYAVQALEKGLNQLQNDEIKNYYNMNLGRYKGYNDFFIKDIIFSYIILFKVLQNMSILDTDIFYEREGYNLNNFVSSSDKLNNTINSIEKFLDKQGLIFEARALFYLGLLINSVAAAQAGKEHKSKPILKKIQFQGMKVNDIYRLYNDIVEKLRQYEIMTLFNEAYMNRFHYYFSNLEKKWSLCDQANVFYIMAGYSYMVSNRSNLSENSSN